MGKNQRGDKPTREEIAWGTWLESKAPITSNRYWQGKAAAHQDVHGRGLHGDVDGVQVRPLDVLHALDVDVEDADLVLGLHSLHCGFAGDRTDGEGVRASSPSTGGLVPPQEVCVGLPRAQTAAGGKEEPALSGFSFLECPLGPWESHDGRCGKR